ncbi:mechanosensitive ion channel family protein [Chondrinema litorale]|uniref:mechanosensitive ion channel family protein n=1 Tax=Chondrinema litorale TaxID=2994555 RepID=UPI00254387E0|nr:mechanosensitive ion channel domain-containing protein [Chondrinema litorale]UZR94702.1 mechanosensitive ion channel [Chondrinema litorale]
MENLDFFKELSVTAAELIITYAPKVLLALVVLLVGLRVINFIMKVINNKLVQTNVDATLRPFAINLLSWTLKIMLFISVASMIGITTSSFVAVLGAAGLAVGLALQGTLSNFAGGILILIFRPYKVGDLVETQGRLGTVKEIQIFTTILSTPDNKMAIIPNGAIMNDEIVNFTTLGKIRVDLTMGISYGADIKKAKEVLEQVMLAHPKVLRDPLPFVGVSELGDSSVNLAVRPYAIPQDYWAVYFDIYENGKIALDDNGIEIPFPQMDVHMKN